jgi:nitroreductase
MTLYETIFIRRSAKQYNSNPLTDDVLANIKKFIAETKQFDGQNSKFEVVASDAVKNASVPHYILSYCEENDASYANVGYVLEKLDLYIQSIGLGSWWIGMQKPKAVAKNFCILMGFGNTIVPQRTKETDFNRLPINEISDTDNTISRAARLAPSAMNSQPWKLSFEKNKVTIAYFGRGFAKMILQKKMNKIDLGIVTRHVEVALLHEGKKITSITPRGTGKEFQIEIVYT